MSDVMSLSSTDDHVKEQEPLLAQGQAGPSRPLDPEMVYRPPPPTGGSPPGRRFRDDPQTSDDSDDGSSDPDDGGRRKLKVKVTLVGFLRFCLVVFSIAGIVCLIGIGPRLFETIVLILLLWLVLFWNVFNLVGPLCGGGGVKQRKMEWYVNVGGCIIGFNGRYDPDGNDDDDEGDAAEELVPSASKKPVKATWLADLNLAVWLTVFSALTTAAFVDHREYARARHAADAMGMAWTVV